MQRTRLVVVLTLALVGVAGLAAPASAAQPRNPYSSFNLSGINYGAQQWDRDQRAGRVVWPSFNTPSRSYARGSNVSVSGYNRGGAFMQSSNYRTTPRNVRRWRR